MGTRHLTVIVKDNKIKLSQYGQWDGYFNGQGENFVKLVREYLQNEYSLAQFKENIDLLKQVDDKTYDELLELSKKAESFQEFSIPFSILLPQFSRDTGTDILRVIAELPTSDFRGKSYPIHICDDAEWCEFIYVLNLDTDEVYMLTDWHFNTAYKQQTCDIIEKKYPEYDCWYKEKIENLPDADAIRKYNATIGMENG